MTFSSSQGLSQNAHKKLRFIPGIVYIDGKWIMNDCVIIFMTCLFWNDFLVIK